MGKLDSIKRKIITVVDSDERKKQSDKRESERGKDLESLERQRQMEKIDRGQRLHSDHVSIKDYARSKLKEAKISAKISAKKNLTREAAIETAKTAGRGLHKAAREAPKHYRQAKRTVSDAKDELSDLGSMFGPSGSSASNNNSDSSFDIGWTFGPESSSTRGKRRQTQDDNYSSFIPSFFGDSGNSNYVSRKTPRSRKSNDDGFSEFFASSHKSTLDNYEAFSGMGYSVNKKKGKKKTIGLFGF